MTEPLDDEALEIRDPAQYQAFGHPLRQRILFALGQEPASISKLAGALGCQKGSIAHHLKVLREAGLVQPGESRQVRGGTEQYFVRTARRFHFAGPAVAAETARMMHVVADEMAASATQPFVLLRQVKLTAQQVQRLIAEMKETGSALEPDPAGSPHKVLLGVYHVAG